MIGYRRARQSGFYYYYRCRPSSTVDVCANRRSHPAEELEYVAASMFETDASTGTLLELYDRAVEEQYGGRSRRAGGRAACSPCRQACGAGGRAQRLSATERPRKAAPEEVMKSWAKEWAKEGVAVDWQ
jgi:hypothetical protein